jgi:hypothetical protein
MSKIWLLEVRGSRNKIENKISLFFFLCFLLCSFIFEVQKTFVALRFALPMALKTFNLVLK